MKYMLLIQEGDTPTPQSPDEWKRLSEDEQKAIYGAYEAINETPERRFLERRLAELQR
jgi:hypothetical protein